jgi:hypothetical protein
VKNWFQAFAFKFNLRHYPVFPWIIADYTSKELDLSVGALYKFNPDPPLESARFQPLNL